MFHPYQIDLHFNAPETHKQQHERSRTIKACKYLPSYLNFDVLVHVLSSFFTTSRCVFVRLFSFSVSLFYRPLKIVWLLLLSLMFFLLRFTQSIWTQRELLTVHSNAMTLRTIIACACHWIRIEIIFWW